MLSMTNRKTQIRQIASAGILTALVFIATFVIKIPIPATEGYVNLGDAVILISSFILGPFAAIPAAIGSALCDLISGYGQYVIPTFVIKGAMGLVAGLFFRAARDGKVSFPRRLSAFVLAELIMAGGYFLFESMPFMYGMSVAVLSVPFNLLQGLAGIILALPVSYVRILSSERFKNK